MTARLCVNPVGYEKGGLPNHVGFLSAECAEVRLCERPSGDINLLMSRGYSNGAGNSRVRDVYIIVLAVLHAHTEHVPKIHLRVQFRGLLTRIPCSPASRCEGLGIVIPIADHPSSLRRGNALGDTSFFEPYEEMWRGRTVEEWGAEK
jgi:hypothetical protein